MSFVLLLPPTSARVSSSDVTRTQTDTLNSKWWSVNTKSVQYCRQVIQKQSYFICTLTQIHSLTLSYKVGNPLVANRSVFQLFLTGKSNYCPLFCTELNPTILKIFQKVYIIKSNHAENISDNVQY